MNKPSEKAMLLARQIGNWLDVKLTEPQGLWALAQKVDTHTAEAIAPYKKALDEAVEGLLYAQNKLYIIVNTKGAVKPYVHVDAVKAKDKVDQTLTTIRAIKGE